VLAPVISDLEDLVMGLGSQIVLMSEARSEACTEFALDMMGLTDLSRPAEAMTESSGEKVTSSTEPCRFETG
jgi:hypothetical protein